MRVQKSMYIQVTQKPSAHQLVRHIMYAIHTCMPRFNQYIYMNMRQEVILIGVKLEMQSQIYGEFFTSLIKVHVFH